MKLHLCYKPTRGKEKNTTKNEEENGVKFKAKFASSMVKIMQNKYSSKLLVPRWF